MSIKNKYIKLFGKKIFCFQIIIVYELLKDKLNIVKLTFSSGVNLASEEYEPHLEVDRCPLCGIALNEDGVCPKCGYKKP